MAGDAPSPASPDPIDRGAAFGHRIVSTEPLVRLGAGEPGPLGSVLVEVAGGRRARPDRDGGADTADLVTPLPRRLDDGRVRLAAPGLATFDLDPAASRITVTDAGHDSIWAHRLLNGALPLLLTAQGFLVAHASAVVVDGRAILFVGPSRRGKSTIAATAADLGWSVLAEDGVLLALGGDGRVDPDAERSQRPVAWPGALDVRLFDRLVGPDERDVPAKLTKALPATRRHRKPAELAAVIVLGPRGGHPPLEELPTRHRVAGLLANTFSVDEATRSEQFPLAVAVVSRVPVVRAHLPEGLHRLPDALRALVRRTCETVAAPRPPESTEVPR